MSHALPLALTACRGAASGCPRAAASDGPDLLRELEASPVLADLTRAVRERLGERPPRHHVFAVSVSACPNGCSRPRIADIGLTGAVRPRLTAAPCLQCGACLTACREGAVALTETGPRLDPERCLECGDCLRACPAGTLAAGQTGWRIWLGGRLGRHPALAEPLPGRRPIDRVIPVVAAGLELWLAGAPGRRFRDALVEARTAGRLPAVLAAAGSSAASAVAVPPAVSHFSVSPAVMAAAPAGDGARFPAISDSEQRAGLEPGAPSAERGTAGDSAPRPPALEACP